MTLLVTGTAGFIGNAVALRLLEQGHAVVGLDNAGAHNDPALKEARLARLHGHAGFREARIDLTDGAAVAALFAEVRPERVVHLAARVGDRDSVAHPEDHVASNLVSFHHVLEGCRRQGVRHLVFASSSSVYGAAAKPPFAEGDPPGEPLSPYAVTKRANELMARTWSHLHGLPATGLRYFTVYGPWGRPDMAVDTFTRRILAGEPIAVYNRGDMARDFVYVDDAVEGTLRALEHPPAPDPTWDPAAPDRDAARPPFRLYNLGSGQATPLEHLITLLEQALGREARREPLPMQPGEMPVTHADMRAFRRDFAFVPDTSLETGIELFVRWYRNYHGG